MPFRHEGRQGSLWSRLPDVAAFQPPPVGGGLAPGSFSHSVQREARRMRYQSLTASTSCICEGCGKRVPADKLYFATIQAQENLLSGNPYRFRVRQDWQTLDPYVTVDAIYNTVCSAACDAKATRQKAEIVVGAIQKVSFDDKGLRGIVTSPLLQRA